MPRTRRLVYERMKKALSNGGVARQPLLIPEVVDLDPSEVTRVTGRAGELAELGLVIEAFGPDAVMVREVPAMLGKLDVKGLVRDLADEIAESGNALSLKERLEEVSGTLACHMSVRAGRRLNAEEMKVAAALRNGGHAPFRPVQPAAGPTYVGLQPATGYREIVRAAVATHPKCHGPGIRAIQLTPLQSFREILPFRVVLLDQIDLPFPLYTSSVEFRGEWPDECHRSSRNRPAVSRRAAW